MKNFLNDWRMVILICLTLGLAPYFPEPHIWGKLRWVRGGATGMTIMDWFDLVFHGLPWILLIRLIVIKLRPQS
ncbi:hypothetical protein [Robiginitalea aurantiaca]|uniref:RND transporter n=1 Tax=Robiginitalea aurantiaca TaxID=3056915 RepID=A0ABT7WHI8_9FLAO|nr:hypothetical protein [Robiginitalea aurantiaca]MDM9632376.1 hypothetical protein [Robiginitalea aurantiaca]